jgi:hypothetical protein
MDEHNEYHFYSDNKVYLLPTDNNTVEYIHKAGYFLTSTVGSTI